MKKNKKKWPGRLTNRYAATSVLADLIEKDIDHWKKQCMKQLLDTYPKVARSKIRIEVRDIPYLIGVMITVYADQLSVYDLKGKRKGPTE